MKELTAPTMRPTTAKLLAIVGKIDNLTDELYKVAAEAEKEDGDIPYTAPEWDEINDNFGRWREGWLTYIFDRMKGGLIQTDYREM